ncbi:MAG: glycosyltransferase family 2 protein [Acidobacteria bacterium]|nr:glycosyltransferase family 2 protein [Acidobacteriota bacterium]
MTEKLPITVLIAVKNEEANIARCLSALSPAARVLLIDSHSADRTAQISRDMGAEVFQFEYKGGYPKKRQWALDHIPIHTDWVFLLDADEVIPPELWEEIADTVRRKDASDAYLVKKGFHFLGRPFRFGGFSHAAVLLFRNGKASFERLHRDPADSQDMEVHERLLVKGSIREFKTPLIHEDAKGLEAYISRHNFYSTWDARQRFHYLKTGSWGEESVEPRFLGNIQERRRWLKRLMLRLPFEPAVWFAYHYIFRLGFLEGRAGLIASQLRARHFSQVRAKLFELQLKNGATAEKAGIEPLY